MKRLIAILLLVAGLAGDAAAQTQAWTNSPDVISPILLKRGAGYQKGYGLTAANDSDRATSLKTAVASAVAGDKVFVFCDCEGAGPFEKLGVQVVRAPGVRIMDTSRTPTMDSDTINAAGANLVLHRDREATVTAPGERFCLFNATFHTSGDYDNLTFVSSGTVTRGKHQATYTNSGASSGVLLANCHIPCADFVTSALIEAQNAVGTYNDTWAGFVRCTTSTSYLPQYRIGAFYRRTPTATQIFCNYDYSGGAVNGTAATVNVVPPFILKCTLKANSITAWVCQNGKETAVAWQEIPVDRLDMQLLSNVNATRPAMGWQSDGAQVSTASGLSCRAGGSQGDREHMIVTEDDGEPIKTADGMYLITADAIQLNSLTESDATYSSQYNRCTGTLYAYDAVSGRMVRPLAKFVQKENGLVFGTQELKILRDRRSGKWHIYASEWNNTTTAKGNPYANGDRVKIEHWERSELPLGYIVLDHADATDVATSNSGAWATGDIYAQDVRRIGSTWYLAGTITDAAAPSTRTSFVRSGTTPTSFPTLVFWDTSNDQDEGAYFWRFGGHEYVAFGGHANGKTTKLYDFRSGTPSTVLRTMNLPGNGRYPSMFALLPVVKDGKTQYQAIGFSDSGGATNGEDYVLDGNGGAVSKVTFGSTLTLNMGEAAGEEYTSLPTPASMISSGNSEPNYSIAP
jgi:hypothetical protein